jgi:hypothetical protein
MGATNHMRRKDDKGKEEITSKVKSGSAPGALQGGNNNNEFRQPPKSGSAPVMSAKSEKPKPKRDPENPFDVVMMKADAIIDQYENKIANDNSENAIPDAESEFIASMKRVIEYIDANKPKKSLFDRFKKSDPHPEDAIILGKSKDILIEFVKTHDEIARNGSVLSWEDGLIQMTRGIKRIQAESPAETQARRDSIRVEEAARQQAKKNTEILFGELNSVLENLESSMAEIAKDKRNHRSPNAKSMLKVIDEWRIAAHRVVLGMPGQNKNAELASITNLPQLLDYMENRLKEIEANPTKTTHPNNLFREQYIQSGERDKNAAEYKALLREASAEIAAVKVELTGPAMRRNLK